MNRLICIAAAATAVLIQGVTPCYAQGRLGQTAAGAYTWFSDGKPVGNTTINPDGTALNRNGTPERDVLKGTWKVTDEGKRQLTVNWNNGKFVDTLVLSPDGRQLIGKNQKGNAVKGVRTAAPAVAAASSVPAGAPEATMPVSPRQVLVKGRKYESATRRHYLIFQPDGNLVVNTSAGQKVWGLDQVVPNVKAQKILVAPDGNLLVQGPGDKYIWSALTADPDPRAFLDLTPAGVLQLVSDRRGILWSSDGKTVGGGRNAAVCVPYDRWAKCVAIANPKIRIMATQAVSASAIALVKQVYTDMTAFMKPAYSKNKFDGFIVYMTNGEPWAQLNGMGPIGPDLGANNSGDELRGGAANDYVWISEQMICKTGVKTRGAKDKSARTLDQVVHEFAHSIDGNFGLRSRIQQLHAKSNAPGEDFAWDVQHWFGSPTGTMSDAERKLVGEIFSQQKTFSCAAYKP